MRTNHENLLSCSWAEVQKLFQAVGSIPKGNLSNTLFLPKQSFSVVYQEHQPVWYTNQGYSQILPRPKFITNHLSSVLPCEEVITHRWAGRVRLGSCFLWMKTQNTVKAVRLTEHRLWLQNRERVRNSPVGASSEVESWSVG